MNFYELLEAVKYADPETKADILDRYYNQEKIIVNAMTERRIHDLKKQKSDSSRSSD